MTQAATITPRVPGDPDEYNDETLVDGTPIELDGSAGNGVWLHQTARSQSGAEQNITSESWTLFLPPDVPFSTTDRIEVDGIVYEADGEPWRAFNPRLKRVTHVEASVRRVA